MFWSHNNYKLIIDPPFRNWWPAIEQKPHTRPERPECLCTMALFLEKKIFLIICYFFQRWPIRATESKQAILTFLASLPETTLGSIKHMHCVLFWFVFLPYYCKWCLYSLWRPGIRTLFAATTFDCHLFTQYVRQFMKAQVANRPLSLGLLVELPSRHFRGTPVFFRFCACTWSPQDGVSSPSSDIF